MIGNIFSGIVSEISSWHAGAGAIDDAATATISQAKLSLFYASLFGLGKMGYDSIPKKEGKQKHKNKKKSFAEGAVVGLGIAAGIGLMSNPNRKTMSKIDEIDKISDNLRFHKPIKVGLVGIALGGALGMAASTYLFNRTPKQTLQDTTIGSAIGGVAGGALGIFLTKRHFAKLGATNLESFKETLDNVEISESPIADIALSIKNDIMRNPFVNMEQRNGIYEYAAIGGATGIITNMISDYRSKKIEGKNDLAKPAIEGALQGSALALGLTAAGTLIARNHLRMATAVKNNEAFDFAQDNYRRSTRRFNVIRESDTYIRVA